METKGLVEQYIEVLSEIGVTEQRIKLLEMELDLIGQQRYEEVELIKKRLEELK